MSGITGKKTLICEIREVLVVDTEVVVEVAEADKEKDDLVWEGEEVLVVMRRSKMGKKQVNLMVRGAAAALPSLRIGELTLVLFGH